MKIAVISASPKGKNSVSLQSARYFQKHHPEVEFVVHHVGQKIKAIERDRKLYDKIMESVKESDCILWVYPVYTFLVPYQLVQFLDLVFQRGQATVFENKYASQILTSKHFHDHTAYNYMHRVSEDLGMKHVHGHCADMDDLTTKEGRKQLLSFAQELVNTVENSTPVSVKYTPTVAVAREYSVPETTEEVVKSENYDIVLLTDCSELDSNLQKMIDTFQKALPNRLRVFNINEFGFLGGCLSCFNCAFDGRCVYKDGFDEFHRMNVMAADCVIIAASISHHWFNPIWKCYDDRQFYNGHRSTMMGKSIGYIVSGPMRQEPNLRQVLEARSEVGQLYLLDIVTDEYDTDEEITALLKGLADKTMWAVENKPQRPSSFLGVGGMKVFRDLVYVMRGLMQEDHRFYKKHGLYDFPQKQVGRILQMQMVGLLVKSPRLRKRMGQRINEMVLKPYSEAVDKY